MISPMRLYTIYLSCSIHFRGTGFNAVKYKFTTKVTEAAMLKHGSRPFFERMSQKFDDDRAAISYIASNFLAGKKWIGQFDNKEELAMEAYRESMEYRFGEDVKYKFANGFPSLKAYVEEMINSQNFKDINFFILFDFATKGEALKKMKKELKDNILFSEFENKLLTISPILVYLWTLDDSARKMLLDVIMKQNKKESTK